MNTIFVSSTFRDMQHERDAIQHIVAPQVNAAARQYGQAVSFCDLRWGINTEGEERFAATRKIIDVCLDEIDRSNPPMVALLGYRYGWTPLVDGRGDSTGYATDESTAMESASLRKGMILDDLEISVTELELRFGSLAADGKQMPILCYLREIEAGDDLPSFFYPEDDWHKSKLEELKQRIHALTGGRVRTYQVRMGERLEDDMRTFANMLTEDLVGMLADEWEAYNRLTPYERTLRTHERLMNDKAELIAVNERLVRDFADRLMYQAGERIILEGESGLGKTTVASATAKRIGDSSRIPVLFLSCGTTSDTTTINGVLGIQARFLSGVLGRVSEQSNGQELISETSDYRNMIERLCVDLDVAGKKAIVVLDAVDQLVGADDLEASGLIPNRRHDSMRMLLTTTRHFDAMGTTYEEIRELETAAEVLEVLGSLERRHAHEVSYDAKQAIVAKMHSRNPLYISLVYQRLLMMWRPDFERIRAMGGNINARAQYEAELVDKCPDDMSEMVLELFDEAGSRINPRLTEIVVNGIAASRYGLRAEDFAAISADDWAQVDFSHVINYLSESFILREDGRYDFSHKALRDALFKSPGAWGTQSDILDYLWGLPEDDPVRISEIAYHCMKADDHTRFSEYIRYCHALENRRAIEAAAACAYHQVHEDNGMWLADFLHRRGPLFARMAWHILKDEEGNENIKNPEQEINPDDWRIVSFICFELYPLFGRDKQDSDLLLKILGDCEQYALATTDEYMEPDTVYFLTIVGMRIAQLTLTTVGTAYNPTFGSWYREPADESERLEECEFALRTIDRSVRVMTPLAKDVDTEACWSMLAYMYLWKSRGLLAIGNSNEAIDAIGSCIEIWEMLWAQNPNEGYRNGYATALADKGRVLLAAGDGRIADAADCLGQALELMGNPEDLTSDDLSDYLAFSTTSVITLCDQGGKKNLEAANRIARKALDLAERLAKEVGGNIAKVRLRDALLARGYVLQASGEYPRIRASIPYYEKAVDLAVMAYQENGAEDDRLSCLLIIDQAINILHFLGDGDSVALAGELLATRSAIDARSEDQIMLGGESALQQQADAELKLDGNISETSKPTSVIEITGDNGERMLAQIVDRFEYLNRNYVAMLEVEGTSDEVIMLTVTDDGNYELYESIDDDDILDAVFNLFKRRNGDFFDFVD